MDRRKFITSIAPAAVTATAIPVLASGQPSPSNVADLLERVMCGVTPLTQDHVGVHIDALKPLCDAVGVEWAEGHWMRGKEGILS